MGEGGSILKRCLPAPGSSEVPAKTPVKNTFIDDKLPTRPFYLV
jgi:hypothetical protein